MAGVEGSLGATLPLGGDKPARMSAVTAFPGSCWPGPETVRGD
jgi:hypothetical protein